MVHLRLWLGGFLPILTWSTCLDHSSLSECLAFRYQDHCLWDVASKTCVSGTSCQNRSSLRECESELTTGAIWDDTQNQCFWDVRFNQCRWSDECFGKDSQQECLQAHCSWRKSCTPQVGSSPNISRQFLKNIWVLGLLNPRDTVAILVPSRWCFLRIHRILMFDEAL